MMRKYKAGGAKKKKAMSGTKMKKAKAGKTMKAQRGSKVVKRDTTSSKKRILRRIMSDGEKAMEKAELYKIKKKKKPKKAMAGLKTPKPSQKGLKKLPTAVRNKMGYAKKGKAVTKAKSGSKMKKKKCKYGCK